METEAYKENNLFKINGYQCIYFLRYNDKEIFDNPKFRLAFALRETGLEKSEYAKAAMLAMPTTHLRGLHENSLE